MEMAKLQNWVEKISYYQKKYHLLWSQLEVLHNLWQIALHIPGVKTAIDKFRAAQYGISDMRRAHDAFKGQQQTADVLVENLQTKQAQLKEIEDIDEQLRVLETGLKSEIDWTAYNDEFEWHVRKRCPIIPIIMPGYFEDLKKHTGKVDFSKWWPG